MGNQYSYPRRVTIPRVKEARLSNSYSTINGDSGQVQADPESVLNINGAGGITVTATEGSPDSLTIDGSGVAGAVDHGGLTGLSDDDHTQYLLVDGSRDATKISLDTSSTPTHDEGDLAWDSDLGLPFIDLNGVDGYLITQRMVKAKNTSGSTIAKNKLVYTTGTTGEQPNIALATNNEPVKFVVLGITMEEIGNNATGFVLTEGMLRNVNTSGYVSGNLLFLGTNGDIATTEPTAPAITVALGAVQRVSATEGSIYFRLVYFSTLNFLSDVNIRDNLPPDGGIIKWDNTYQRWNAHDYDHGTLSGLADDDHTQYLTTARGDARYYTETELDAGQLNTLYYTEDEIDTMIDVAFAASGVTNGDSHDHSGGDGAQIDHTTLSNVGTNTHAQLDSHVADNTLHFIESSIDHGTISGLADDDHSQYLLIDGTRAMTGNLDVVSDTDGYAKIGRAHVGYIGTSDVAGFSHVDNATIANCAFRQTAAGATTLNSKGGQNLLFTISNATTWYIDSNGHLINAGSFTSLQNLTGSAAAPTYAFSGDTDTGMWRAAADILAFSTGGSERVRIDSSGQVGIGTTSPGYGFHVDVLGYYNGIILETGSMHYYNNTEGIVFAGGSAAANGANIELYGGAHASLANRAYYDANLHTFRTQAGATFAVIDTSNSKMGVGTDSPAEKLHVNGNARTGKSMMTDEGGFAIQLTNKTGVNSVKGSIVSPATGTDDAFTLTTADDVNPIGIVYEDGIGDGSGCWVTVAGIADVLLEETTAATRGYWAKVSDNENGRADITNTAPPGGTIGALEDHFSEIGHCIETVASGVNQLARVVVHFN